MGKRSKLNRDIKRYGVDNGYTQVIVQLTEENFKLKTLLFILKQEEYSEDKDKEFTRWLSSELDNINIPDERLMQFLKQVDEYNVIRKEDLKNRGKIEYAIT